MADWTDKEIAADARDVYARFGAEACALNPFIAGHGREREAQLWHQAFAAARTQDRVLGRIANYQTPKQPLRPKQPKRPKRWPPVLEEHAH